MDNTGYYPFNLPSQLPYPYLPASQQHHEQNLQPPCGLPPVPNGAFWPQDVFTKHDIPDFPGASGVGDVFDLGNVTANLQDVDAMEISTLFRGVNDAPWQPQSFQGYSNVRVPLATAPMLVRNMSRDLPSHREESDMIDSGIGSCLPSSSFPETTEYVQRAKSQQGVSFAVPPRPDHSMKRSKSSKSAYNKPSGPASAGSTKRRSSWVSVTCAQCPKMLNSRSEQTKHLKQHDKPYLCPVLECPRSKDRQGFGTPNDLVRHQRDKHKMRGLTGLSDKGYVCHACEMADTRPKWWPRLDNFKAHAKRKHPELDEHTLVIKSFREARPVDTVSEVGTAISGRPSNYFSQSHPDSETHYQQQYDFGSSPSSAYQALPAGMFQSYHSQFQGEITMPWCDDQHFPSSMSSGTAGAARPTPQANDYSAFARHINPCSRQPCGCHRLQSNGHVITVPCCNHAATTINVGLQPASAEVGLRKETNTDMGHEQTEFNTGTNVIERDVHDMAGTTLKRRWAGEDDDNGPKHKAPKTIRCRKAGCSTVWYRPSEMKKHMKRHDRPYGCTYSGCYDKFGAKWEWRRHEIQQHKLHKAWLCTEMASDGRATCNKYFEMEDRFRQHLEGRCHNIASDDATDRIREMCLGEDGRDRFWCGFCNAVAPNPFKQEGTFLSQRYEHVGAHMDAKAGCHIDNWICVFFQKKKKDIVAMEKRAYAMVEDMFPGSDEPYDAMYAFQRRYAAT